MKVESRGKFPGAKVHLDSNECRSLIEWFTEFENNTVGYDTENNMHFFARKLGKKIRKSLTNNPKMLDERTPEEVLRAVEIELKKAQQRLDNMKVAIVVEDMDEGEDEGDPLEEDEDGN